jgi:hypothetical protein
MAAIPDTVRPGDIISADLLNRIIRLLNEHDAQLTGGSGPLSISHVQPQVVRMGEELKVFGSGLSPSSLQRISVEGTDVQLSALTTGTDTLIAFIVPPIIGIPDNGKTVVVMVQNKAGQSDQESLFLLPGIATNLEASFNVTRTAVSPDEELQADSDYEFTFAIQAFTSRDETYLLEPVLQNAPAGWTASMKGGSSNLFIPRSQPTPSTTPVVVTVHTGAAGSASLSLGLRAKNFAGVTGSSQAEPIAIAQAPEEPNLDITFHTPQIIGSLPKFTGGILYVPANADATKQKAIINPLNVTLVQAGIYDIGPAEVSDPKWSITLNHTPPPVLDSTNAPNAVRPVRFTVAAQANAPDAEAEIPIVGREGLPQTSFRFKLRLRADPSNPIPE